MVIHLWKRGKGCPEKLIGEYDLERSPDRLDYSAGRILDKKLLSQTPIIDFEVKRERLQRIDCLAHTGAGIPLVNQRVIDILMEITDTDFQLIKPQLNCLDGELNGYYLLNITHTINGVDHSQSTCEWGHDLTYIIGFKRLVMLPDCMGHHHLAREAEFHPDLYVSQTIVDAFERAHIKGCWFPLPEEYHRSFHNF